MAMKQRGLVQDKPSAKPTHFCETPYHTLFTRSTHTKGLKARKEGL